MGRSKALSISWKASSARILAQNRSVVYVDRCRIARATASTLAPQSTERRVKAARKVFKEKSTPLLCERWAFSSRSIGSLK